jgi:hypothetical protein
MKTAQMVPTLGVLVCLAEGSEVSLAELVTFMTTTSLCNK